MSGLTVMAKLATETSPSAAIDSSSGPPDALFEHAPGEVVGHLEVEGAAEHALRLDQADEAVQLGGDAVVGGQTREHGPPEVLDRIDGVRHGDFSFCR